MCEFYESRQSCRVSDAALPTQTSVPRTPAINCAIQSPQTSSMQLSSPIFLLFFFSMQKQTRSDCNYSLIGALLGEDTAVTTV